jgi:septal ring factor EnvC (AmiA/AmiB activator)
VFISLPDDSPQFFWPVVGRVHTDGALHGVEISAPQGSVVRAARQGRVAVATQALAGRGPTLVLTHEGGYASIYAGVEALLVVPGAEVAQGSPIARLGLNPLHFEIRLDATPVPMMLSLLPSDP